MEDVKLAVRIRDGNEENTISLLQTQFIEGSLGLEVRVRNNPEPPPPPAKKNSNEGPEPGTVTEGGIVDTPNDARISGAALLFEIKQEQTPVEPEISGVRSGIMQGMMTKRKQDKESNEIPNKRQSTGRNHHDHKST
mmetsp:Transcript_25609/g.36473  ORF Transcript_25609/g.36473 Transcript_25609/m.36473 type:complete len:137 (-) Transcript_25609:57-467(-)